MNPRTREEEYLRRMKALGYEPSLRGMDDDDIEWELSKMEEADRRREAQLQPQQQPLRTIYRPVDPGLKARILRQFGQPYDESAIPKGQEFYLNGWDNGEDEVTPQVKSFVTQGREKKSDINDPDFDPWKNAWKLDWGNDGSALAGSQTMEWRPEREGATFHRQETFTPLSYNQNDDTKTGMQSTAGAVAVAGAVAKGANNDSGGVVDEIKKFGKKYDKQLGVAGSAIKVYKDASDFAKEVEKAALEQHPNNPDLAKKKAQDAAGTYSAYLIALSGFGGALSGGKGAIVTESVGAFVSDGIKDTIKKQVLGKTDDDYNQMAPGATMPGPG